MERLPRAQVPPVAGLLRPSAPHPSTPTQPQPPTMCPAEYMARLKLRELLMPEVVSLVDADAAPGSNGSSSSGRPQRAVPRGLTARSWAVSPKLFPCEVSPEARGLAGEAVAAAVAAWGPRQLEELEAEDRLAVACERAPSVDPVIQKLRAAFLKVIRVWVLWIRVWGWSGGTDPVIQKLRAALKLIRI